jgi:hypothetical protein
MMKFDEPQLIQELERLTPPLRVAFAAACAERLLPAYLAYAGRHEIGNPGTLRAALDGAWLVALGGDLTFDPEQEFERCAALVPGDDDCANEGSALAEDAASAVAYVVTSAASGDPHKAVLSARCGYEALDNYLSNELDIDFNRPGAEATVLGHPLVQAEFERQRRDLEELATAGSDAAAVVLRIQARAIEEAREFFGRGS